MSESISNVRNNPPAAPTPQIRPVRRPMRDEKSGDQDAEQQEPAGRGDDSGSDAADTDAARDRDDHLLDEYV